MKNISFPLGLLAAAWLLSGCSTIGDKAGSLTIVYLVVAALSLLILAGYFCLVRKKDPWFVLLFCAVPVVNIGYFWLSVSDSLSVALMANRLSYLGSVFLPLAMLMIILGATNISYRKWVPALLVAVSILVFLVAASPGLLDIYYKEVQFHKVNGVGCLEKVYGSWHGMYLIYLMGYFGAMIFIIIYATVKKKVDSLSYAVIMAIAVFVNLGVWLIEQLVSIEFEILSVSYIISELFLLGLHFMRAEQQKAVQAPPPPQPVPLPQADAEDLSPEQFASFTAGIDELTPTERLIFDAYIAGKTTKEIMAELNIKENTLKFHNKNIYCKLGVSSRKELVRIHKLQKMTPAFDECYNSGMDLPKN